jgi:hypothetical protein
MKDTMTNSRFVPENRLSHVVDGPGGLTAETLEERAAESVATLEPALKAHIAVQVAIIQRMALEKEEIIFARCLMLSDAALSICETAGAAGLAPLGEAAKGIVAMIDGLIEEGVWHTEALKLHINALISFAAEPPPSAAKIRKVLSQLQALRQEIGVPE